MSTREDVCGVGRELGELKSVRSKMEVVVRKGTMERVWGAESEVNRHGKLNNKQKKLQTLINLTFISHNNRIISSY